MVQWSRILKNIYRVISKCYSGAPEITRTQIIIFVLENYLGTSIPTTMSAPTGIGSVSAGRKRKAPKKMPAKSRALSRVAKSQVKQIANNVLAQDFHYLDSYIADTTISPTWIAGCLPSATGDTTTTRTGKKIQLTSLQVELSGYNVSAAASHNQLRIAIVRVLRAPTNSGTDFGYSDVYDLAAGSFLTEHRPLAPRKIRDGKLDNFQVMKTWNVDLGPPGDAADKNTFRLSYYKEFKKPLTVWYDTDSNAAPVQNNIIVVAGTDAIANYPIMCMVSRAKFIP